MATSLKNLVHGQIKIKGEQPNFYGDEILYISVRDSLRHDRECIELGSRTIYLKKRQLFPIDYLCFYDPYKAHMKFNEIIKIPGGITLSARIERNDQLLYINNTDTALADNIDILLVKVE
jgi:uncharacterized lipoprotein YbaY